MKWMRGIAVAAVIVAMAACGGSSDSSTGGGGTTGTTPAATSAATMAAMTNASMWMYGTALGIPGALPTAMVVKETTYGNVSCTGTYSGFECVIWDSLGSATSSDHKCDVTGSMDAMGNSFTLAYDCVNFNPDTSVTVDGNWTVDMTVSDMGSMASASVEKDVTKEDATGGCDVESVADVCGSSMTVGEGTCSVECGSSAACDAGSALMTMTWTVGSRGITMTDDCGTYVIDPGTTSSIYLCSASSTGFVISFDMSGVINDGAVDEVITIDCSGIVVY